MACFDCACLCYLYLTTIKHTDKQLIIDLYESRFLTYANANYILVGVYWKSNVVMPRRGVSLRKMNRLSRHQLVNVYNGAFHSYKMMFF